MSLIWNVSIYESWVCHMLSQHQSASLQPPCWSQHDVYWPKKHFSLYVAAVPQMATWGWLSFNIAVATCIFGLSLGFLEFDWPHTQGKKMGILLFIFIFKFHKHSAAFLCFFFTLFLVFIFDSWSVKLKQIKSFIQIKSQTACVNLLISLEIKVTRDSHM